MLNFDFLEKGLGIVFPANVVYDFPKKKCFSRYISLSNCLYFLRYWGNICIGIVCFPVCNVINFEINLIFLIRLFFNKAKTSRQKSRKKRAFKLK